MTIDYDIIDEMEEFVKNDIMELLQSQTLEPLKEFEMKHIFGSNDKIGDKFHFEKEEKCLIRQIKDHFCYMNDLDNAQQALSNFYLEDDMFESDRNNKKSSHVVQEKFPTTEQPKIRAQEILNRFLETANQNAYMKSGGNRFNEDIKWFAAHFRILSGPLAFECIQRNLEGALPSLSSTNRYIHESHHRVNEGILRENELLLFLKSGDLPLYVSLSEDATRIEGRIQYDHYNNQLVGFVLPTNPGT